MRPAFLRISAGSLVSWKDGTYKVRKVVDLRTVVATDVTRGIEAVLPLQELEPIQSDPAEASAEGPANSGMFSEDWETAQARYTAIRPLLDNPYRTREDAKAAAKAAGVHPNTVYKWFKIFRDSGHVSSLIPNKRGRRKKDYGLDPETEAVISAAIDEVYATTQRGSMEAVITRVMQICRQAGIKAPHPNTVRNRIRVRPTLEMLQRRGKREEARNLYAPAAGHFPDADYPYHTVQIDHTRADVIVVDPETREPIGRPWLTLAIDVFSRMVAGWYVSMEAPGVGGTGICLTRAMLPKEKLLAELDVPGEWPVFGKVNTIHMDNAKEFRSVVLEKACAEYGINLVLRPVKQPWYGAHIERLMGTVATQLKKLPGATFSSPAERKGYDSEGRAALTLREFEAYLIEFIVNTYHQRVHSSLKCPPIRKWREGLLGDDSAPGRGQIAVPGDPERLVLDFLPAKERTVQPYGIVIDRMHYFHEVLVPWINALDPKDRKRKRTFICRRDPRDITRIYFLDPESNEYHMIPCRNTGRPPVSVWEWREACKRADAIGRDAVDEDAVFESLQRMRTQVDEAVKKTQVQRRARHRTEAAEKHAKAKGGARGKPATTPTSPRAAGGLAKTALEDLFSSPVERFPDTHP